MVDSTDHVTPKTGLSPTVTLSKAGGSFASPSGAVTEIANGWYKVAGNATDTNTLGALILHATGTGADPTDIYFDVIAIDPQIASIPPVAFNRVGGLGSNILADSATNSSGMFSATSTQYAFTALNMPAASLVSGGVKGCLFVIKSGTGFGQSPRVITNATYSTGVVVLTFATAWTTTPDSSTTWEIWHTRMPSLDASLRPSVLDSNGANFDATATSASPEDIAASIRAIIPTTVGNPFIATKDLAAIPAASAHPIQWTVLNNGAAVDLTGKTVRCVFALVTDAGAVDDRTDDTLAAAFQYQTGGDGIVISGTSSNIVTLTHSVTKTAEPGAYRYWLWNITDNVVLARGRAPIEAAAKSV